MRLVDILSEKYTKGQGRDVIALTDEFLEWRDVIMSETESQMVAMENEFKQAVREYRARMSEISKQKRQNLMKNVSNTFKKGTDKSEIIPSDEPPEKPNFYKMFSFEERIVRGDSGVGVAFISADESEGYCGRAAELFGDGFNCYNPSYKAMSYDLMPSSFLKHADDFGVLYHEWYHSTQYSMSDSHELPHNLRVQEIDAVLASSLAPMISKLLKRSPGDGAKRFLRSRGFKDDYGHFVREFLPKQVTIFKSMINNPGGPAWQYLDDVHRSTAVHKMFFAYLRAYYRGDYTPHMSFPDNYWKDAPDRKRGT